MENTLSANTLLENTLLENTRLKTATDTEISVKTVFGDQLNGLGTSWLGGEGPPRSKIKK